MPHAPRFAHRTVRHGQSDLSAMPPPLPGLVIAYRSVLHRTSDVSTSPGRVRMRCLAGNTGTDEFTSVASLLTGAVTDRVTLTLQASGTTHLRYYHLPAPAPAVSRVDISQDDKTWNDGRPQRQCDPGSARAPAASFRSADGPPHSTWSSYWTLPLALKSGIGTSLAQGCAPLPTRHCLCPALLASWRCRPHLSRINSATRFWLPEHVELMPRSADGIIVKAKGEGARAHSA